MNKDTDIFLNMNKNYSYWSGDGSWVQKSHHMVSKSSEEAADSGWFLMRLPWGAGVCGHSGGFGGTTGVTKKG